MPTAEFCTDDEGLASILGAFVVAAIVVVTALVLYTGGAVAARHRAQSAADFAALAGASALDSGNVAGCDAAREMAAANGAELDDCRVEDWDLQVHVHVRTALSRFGVRDAVAVSRAGPVEG
jgi:secretion/DNA translocation related TadE-like protein